MIALLIVAGSIAWTVVAAGVGILLGKGIRLADKRADGVR